MPIHRRCGHDDHHRHQRGHRNAADGLAKEQAEDKEEGAREERRQARARLGCLHADHGLANHGAHAHAANGRGEDIAHALAKGLARLIGVGIRNVIDQLGRQQRFHQAHQSHAKGIRSNKLQSIQVPRNIRHEKPRQRGGQLALVRHIGHLPPSRHRNDADHQNGNQRGGNHRGQPR